MNFRKHILRKGNILVYMYHLKHEGALAARLLVLRNDTPFIKSLHLNLTVFQYILYFFYIITKTMGMEMGRKVKRDHHDPNKGIFCCRTLLFYAYSPRAYTFQVRKVTTYSIMFHLIYVHANLWSLCSGAISCLELVLWNWFCVCLHVQLVVCYRFERAIELKTDNEVCLLCF